MTCINKKSTAVKFDSKRHYRPSDAPLKGRIWTVSKERSTEKIVKVVLECDCLACPDQSSNCYLSRIKGSPNMVEWVNN